VDGPTNVFEEYTLSIFRAENIPPKRWCLLTSPHGFASWKTSTVRRENLISPTDIEFIQDAKK
jgi:hypothetical protein